MAQFSAGVLTTAGSTTNPIISLYGSTTVLARIREIGVFNTTAVAVALKLVRLTTTGTQGANLVEAPLAPQDPNTPSATAWGTHTSTGPTLGNDLGYRTVLGAAVGSGCIWTFGGAGLCVTAAANAGIGVIVENGTGQACQAYIAWDESIA
jgi:hypothetical protein